VSGFPDTKDRDNWSVFLFDCPKDRVQSLLVTLFRVAKEIVPNSLPNYTMRHWDAKYVKISFRVLRNKHEKEVVEILEKEICGILRDQAQNIVVNPEGRDAQTSGWGASAPLGKCRAYNRLSEFVVKLAEEELFKVGDRNEMRHLAINMLFMREAARSEPYALFVDMISGRILRQPYPFRV